MIVVIDTNALLPMLGASHPFHEILRMWMRGGFVLALGTEILLESLSYVGTDVQKTKQKLEAESLIKEWINNPFSPHMIARHRPVVYMKYVFRKYADNLLELIDSLRARGTIEADNEALHICVLLANLLGPEAQEVPAAVFGRISWRKPETWESANALCF